MDIEKEKTMAKNEDGYEKYLGYIEDSLDEVAEKVTRIFDERKKGLAATLCGMLRDAASCATHYEWRRGDCPYGKKANTCEYTMICWQMEKKICLTVY